ncbi:7 transmembrane receptor [Aphelenchoides besseyi]|nr:7 transmembrane receptor [Aphelenchoides besseyi]KAI6200602.1 7 transmembrane receptor [Aphelenchoides besseyi]
MTNQLTTVGNAQFVDGLKRNPQMFWTLMREHPELVKTFQRLVMNSSDDDTTICYHYSESNPDPTNSPVVIAIFSVIYVHIFLLGLIGNLSIIVLTLRYRHLRTVQNIFILNLAISDVVVCLLSVPLTPITSSQKIWIFSRPLCHLLPMVQAVSIFVSTLSLSAIAIDRYNLVVRPHAKALTNRGATNIATVLWIISVIVSLPYGYYMTLDTYPQVCGEFCTENWPSKSIQRVYALIVLILQFLLPFMTMSFCYSTIFSRLRERANSKLRKLNERSQLLSIRSTAPSSSEETPVNSHTVAAANAHRKAVAQQSAGDDAQRTLLLAQQRRTTSILAAMVLIFGLTWLPQNIFTLLIEYDEDILTFGDTNFTYLASLIAHSIAMLTNIINPLLYAWVNPSFKELFLNAFKSRRLPDSLESTRIQREPSQKLAARDSVARVNGSKKASDDVV